MRALAASGRGPRRRNQSDPGTSDPTDDSIGTWIEDYPATLISLPDEAWAHAERGRCVDDPNSWWVVIDLWTAEEGHSDLTMEATVRDDKMATSS
jgi:hypothetical protein